MSLTAEQSTNMQHLSMINDDPGLSRLDGQIQGLEFVIQNMCSCEIKPQGVDWLKKQVNSRKIRLTKLLNERTSAT